MLSQIDPNKYIELMTAFMHVPDVGVMLFDDIAPFDEVLDSVRDVYDSIEKNTMTKQKAGRLYHQLSYRCFSSLCGLRVTYLSLGVGVSETQYMRLVISLCKQPHSLQDIIRLEEDLRTTFCFLYAYENGDIDPEADLTMRVAPTCNLLAGDEWDLSHDCDTFVDLLREGDEEEVYDKVRERIRNILRTYSQPLSLVFVNHTPEFGQIYEITQDRICAAYADLAIKHADIMHPVFAEALEVLNEAQETGYADAPDAAIEQHALQIVSTLVYDEILSQAEALNVLTKFYKMFCKSPTQAKQYILGVRANCIAETKNQNNKGTK